jgi:hypothetical protein
MPEKGIRNNEKEEEEEEEEEEGNPRDKAARTCT